MLQTTRPRKPLTLQMTVMFTPTPVTAFDENANYQNRLNEVVNALQDIMQKRLRRDARVLLVFPKRGYSIIHKIKPMDLQLISIMRKIKG